MTSTIPSETAEAGPGSSPRRWPGLRPPPPGLRTRLSAAVARQLFLTACRHLHVYIHEEGLRVGRGGPSMTVRRPEEFYARVGRDGLIGFGESYLTGAWEAEDLGGFLTVLAAELPTLVPEWMQRLRSTYVRRPPRHQESSRENTQANIAHHYDLSNDLFRLFLDSTLSYSCGLYDVSQTRQRDEVGPYLQAAPPEPDSGTLADAQARKMERLLDEAGVTAGTRVLEIGTGWGELAIRAARRGATVHSITLSSEQRDLARDRIAEAGVADHVEVELCDYRDLAEHPAGGYDAIVSVEMIEAVGYDYWATYFRILEHALAPGGRVAIQAITMPHDRMLATRRTWTWIHKYIFPGGFLPSVRALDEVTREHTSLRITERLAMGQHYAKTLQEWDLEFLRRGEQVRALGFDATFQRMWHFYLEYSRGGFASGYLDDVQLTLHRDGGDLS